MILTNVFRTSRTALSHWIPNRVARLPAHSLLIVLPIILTCGVGAVLVTRVHVIADTLTARPFEFLIAAGLLGLAPPDLPASLLRKLRELATALYPLPIDDRTAEQVLEKRRQHMAGHGRRLSGRPPRWMALHAIAAFATGTATALLVAGLAGGRPDGLSALTGGLIACGVLYSVIPAVPNAIFNEKPARIPDDGFDTFCSATELSTLVPRAPVRNSPFLQRPGR